jgi:hypothetical protein
MRDALGEVQSILVLGGTSEIALATVAELAESGRIRTVVLAGRDPATAKPAAARLHALGVGGCMAALLGTLGARDTRQGQRPAEFASIALMGVGFVLTAAWAWLNWGVAWRNDPRLNLMVAGWLCVVAGRFLRRDALEWGLAAEWAGVGLMLVGAFAADWIAAAWPGLSFVAW